MIEFHADDYGLFEGQSSRIRECIEHGAINGISVMANSPNLPQMIRKVLGRDILIATHLNLVEGKPLCDPSRVPDLVNGDGVFDVSFTKLLAASFLPGRRAKYREQIRTEFEAQIGKTRELVGDRPLRLDGHVHYHMIPVVFDAMMDVIREQNLTVEYIRIPREYLSVYWKNRKAVSGISFLNFVKVLVLNLLSLRSERKYRDFLGTTKRAVFLGVALSGNMTEENVSAILEDGGKIARKRGEDLEVLFHPGYVDEKEDVAQLTAADDIAFMTDRRRLREAEAAKAMGERGIGIG